MAVTVYRHTDASAPTLTGSVGSLTALLLACLVNGYGAKAAAGWTNPYNGTNQAVFRPGSGTQHYFAVDDNATGTGLAKEALFTGYETMTAWATGTGQFPTATQLSGGLVTVKSSTADATARPWVIVADARTAYIFMDFSHTTANYSAGIVPIYSCFMIGEFYSLLAAGDSYRSMVIGRTVQNSNTSPNETTLGLLSVTANAGGWASLPGHYVPRAYTGIGTSATAAKWGDTARGSLLSTGNFSGTAGLSVPDPVIGAIHLAPIHMTDSTAAGNPRGRMRGMFQPCHSVQPFADGDTIAGSGAYAGRNFMMVKGVQAGNGTYSNTAGGVAFDITGAWETN